MKEKLTELARLKLEVEAAYGIYAGKKSEYDFVKQELISELDKLGMKSAGNDQIKIAKTNKASIRITNEGDLASWIHDNLAEPDIYYHQGVVFEMDKLNPILKETMVKNGEVVKGAEIQTSEYLTVSKVK
ncbi:hypothetical protein [Polynucleobacter sp.]|uniref:hypothetical protein n=1 Tax=Polynucleobacter sp. TaxID=2029855 RepID=UPI003F699E54